MRSGDKLPLHVILYTLQSLHRHICQIPVTLFSICNTSLHFTLKTLFSTAQWERFQQPSGWHWQCWCCAFLSCALVKFCRWTWDVSHPRKPCRSGENVKLEVGCKRFTNQWCFGEQGCPQTEKKTSAFRSLWWTEPYHIMSPLNCEQQKTLMSPKSMESWGMLCNHTLHVMNCPRENRLRQQFFRWWFLICRQTCLLISGQSQSSNYAPTSYKCSFHPTCMRYKPIYNWEGPTLYSLIPR